MDTSTQHTLDMMDSLFPKMEERLDEIRITDSRDPDYDTRADEAKDAEIEIEAKRLLESPTELLDADIDCFISIYAKHGGDMCDLGECIHRYMTGLANDQAKENIGE